MAGDWIPIRCNLFDDPAVIAIASAVGIDECAVVGRLVKVWAWANEQTADGNAHGVTETWIDRYVGVSGFAQGMLKVGWLVATESGIGFPKFDRWNSQSAKKRVVANQRVAKHRSNARSVTPNPQSATGGNAARVSKALPEKRREEKRREKTPPTPADAGGACAGDPPTPDFVSENPGAFAEVVEPEPFADLVATWTAAKLPGHDAPGGIQRSSYRVELWQQRFRDPEWRANWRVAVTRAGQSARCRGESGTWKLPLDTFLRNERGLLRRILEGEFDDTRAPPRGDQKTDYAKRTARDAMGLDDAA